MKLLRFLLFPIAVIYNLITSVRNLLFDIGWLKSISFDVPVIAVGNLSVGGTGKTPQIEYLIRLLQNEFKIAVLSRGYKRKMKGFQLINNKHSAIDVGDEPFQFYQKFKNIQVAVDGDRRNGITQLLKKNNSPEVILLDDAFQHRKVKASFYILLTKYNDLYANDFLLPTGNLRESRKGAKRADLIIVTKCPLILSKDEKEKVIQNLNPIKNQQVFFTSIFYEEKLKGSEEISVKSLMNYEVVLVTGIANPKSLLDYFDSLNVKYTHMKYPDHYHFLESDIAAIEKKYSDISSKNKLIVTTEKDYVRLESMLKNVCYLEIETSFMEKEKNFNLEILNAIKKVNI